MNQSLPIHGKLLKEWYGYTPSIFQIEKRSVSFRLFIQTTEFQKIISIQINLFCFPCRFCNFARSCNLENRELDALTVHIDLLRGKAASLGQRVNTLAEENRLLRSKLDGLSATLAGRDEEIRDLKQQFEILKMARSLHSGDSGDSKTEDLKKKINDYIKEIDQCLKLIGD